MYLHQPVFTAINWLKSIMSLLPDNWHAAIGFISICIIFLFCPKPSNKQYNHLLVCVQVWATEDEYGLIFSRQTDLQSTAGPLHYSHAEGLGQGGVEEDMSLNQHPTHILMLQGPQEMHPWERSKSDTCSTCKHHIHTHHCIIVPVVQLVFLSHFLQHDSLWSLSTNQEMQIGMFEAQLWDDPTQKIYS